MRIEIISRAQRMLYACTGQPTTLLLHAKRHLNADEAIAEAALGHHIHLQRPASINRPTLVDRDKRGGR